MPLDTTQVNRILGAARARDPQKVEELWIELQSQDEGLTELKTFLRVASEVASRGDKDKAADLLLLLKDDLKEGERDDELFEVLRKAVSYSPRVKGVREELVTQYRRKYADRPGLDAIISRTDLGGEGDLGEAVSALDQAFHLSVGDFVFHAKGWGIGKVAEASPSTGEFVIDFAKRRGQRMDAAMALHALEPRAADDIDVLLWTDKDEIRRLAKKDPLLLLRKALESAPDNRVQSRIFKEKLADVLEKSAWTRFWNKARKEAKADPNIEIGTGARAVIQLREVPLTRDDEIANQILKSADYKTKIIPARRELLSFKKDTAKSEAPGWLAPVVAELEKGRRKSAKTPTAYIQASHLETAYFKSEAAALWPDALDVEPFGGSVDPETGEPAVDPETGEPLADRLPTHILQQLGAITAESLPQILYGMAVPEYRKRTLNLLPQADADHAATCLESALLDPASQVFPEAVSVLKKIGRDDVILSAVTKILIEPHEHPAGLAAFARMRLGGKLDVLPDRGDAEILAKTIQVLDTVSLRHKAVSERAERAELKVQVDALRAVLSDKNQQVISRVVANSTEDQVRRILLLVRHSPTVTATIQRATDKFVLEHFPELLGSLGASDIDQGPPPLYSTLAGRKRRERELNEIMEVKMAEISLEIGRALEFGDISENAELDAAREKQQRLAEQATRIQSDLERVIIVDPATVDTDEVRVGNQVTATNLTTGQDETYKILGPWDLSDDDPSIISHMSALSQGLLGTTVGTTISILLPSGDNAEYEVKSIAKIHLTEEGEVALPANAPSGEASS